LFPGYKSGKLRRLRSTFIVILWLHYRRIRELNENNTKKFIEERKRQAVLQSRQIEAIRKTHEQQLAKLAKDLDWV